MQARRRFRRWWRRECTGPCRVCGQPAVETRGWASGPWHGNPEDGFYGTSEAPLFLVCTREPCRAVTVEQYLAAAGDGWTWDRWFAPDHPPGRPRGTARHRHLRRTRELQAARREEREIERGAARFRELLRSTGETQASLELTNWPRFTAVDLGGP